MTGSISAYNEQYPMYYQNNNQRQNPSVIKNAMYGFLGGTVVMAGVDYYKTKRAITDNNVSDSYAKRILDKYIKKGYAAKGREFFKQKYRVLDKLGCISSPEKFKKLMTSNREYCKTLCDGISLEAMCKSVTKDNVKDKASALLRRIEASLEPELQNVKDSIKLCWDSENKKFVKSKKVDDNLYKIIKNTKNNIDWKKALKTGGIIAAIAGVLTLGLNFITRKHNQEV